MNTPNKQAELHTKEVIKSFLKDKKGLEKLSKEISWLYNTPDDLIEMVFNSGKTQALSKFKEKIIEIIHLLEDSGYLTFWIRNGRDGKDELRAELNKTAQEIKWM